MNEYDSSLAKLQQLEALGQSNTGMPDIYFVPGNNPLISCANDPMVLQFKQTKESLLNVDDYRQFLENAISNFRKTRTYKNYKAFLMELGLNRCQVHGNITSEMATLEMHHNMLNIFDIAYIITSHITNTSNEGLTSMQLCYMLKKVHKEHKVQLVMLSLTPHQLYHNTDQLSIPPEMCFGDWYSFLKEYRYGISKDIAYKILFYLKEFEENDFGLNYDILNIRQEIYDWSEYNDRLVSLPDAQPYDPNLTSMYDPFMFQGNAF